MTTAAFTLYTFAMSHYSEKIRWTLDHAAIPYREQCLTPVFHIGPALRMGGRGQTTLPLLKTPHESVQDSARILNWLHQQNLASALMPAKGYDEIREVEQRFNAIGKDVARLLYARSFGHADAHIVQLWCNHASPAQARFIRLAYPVIRWGFRRKLHITTAGADKAQHKIDEVVNWLEARLKDGRIYLVGDHFTVADITAASLLAPIACPPEHPVYGDADYQQAMRGATAPWQGRPALAWVLKMYATQRGQMQGGVKL